MEKIIILLILELANVYAAVSRFVVIMTMKAMYIVMIVIVAIIVIIVMEVIG